MVGTTVQNHQCENRTNDQRSDSTCYAVLRKNPHRRGFDGVGRGLSRAELSAEFVTRFHGKYKRSDVGCWLWQAGKYPRGYGMVCVGRFGGKQHNTYAHRASYVLAHGDIPAGAVIMHSCDVTACVNPAHLSLGTQRDNVLDASRKGHYKVPHFGKRKLTDQDVFDIRTSGARNVELAKRFNVSASCISVIRRGLRRAA